MKGTAVGLDGGRLGRVALGEGEDAKPADELDGARVICVGVGASDWKGAWHVSRGDLVSKVRYKHGCRQTTHVA